MKQSLKRIVPDFIWHFGSNLYWGWHNRGRHNMARLLSPRWAKSRRDLTNFRNKHLGKRCFIIGNGPSLKKMDLSILKDEITFGLNRIYLLFPELGFDTTYLVSVNDLVLEQCANEIKALEIPKFITWRARRRLTNDPQCIFMDTDYTGPESFSTVVTGRVFEGFTVTYVAMQLAFHMGFNEVILIGVDHNFVTQGLANATVVSNGDDPNHFIPTYFGKGFKWQLPDLEGSERAYRMAKKAFEEAGRSILDATINGKLGIFRKVTYDELFGKKEDAKR